MAYTWSPHGPGKQVAQLHIPPVVAAKYCSTIRPATVPLLVGINGGAQKHESHATFPL
jgi:hypothetical protein